MIRDDPGSTRAFVAERPSFEVAAGACAPVGTARRAKLGRFAHLPEQAFDMRGGIDEVLDAAEKMKAGV